MAFDYLEARQTLYDAISAAVGILVDPVNQAFPGVEIKNPGAVLRMEVNQISGGTPMLDLKGNIITEEGMLRIIMVGERGVGEEPCMAVAQVIADAMTAASTYAVAGGGLVTLTNHPQVKEGYPDETSWRVPVEIEYFARA